ncbi:MAG TPA: hypothetical protein VK738_05365 [Terriglobales bacterium]|jgi:hypothetical protein|nr:hypothetical protein [Terriglobales bacterium]
MQKGVKAVSIAALAVLLLVIVAFTVYHFQSGKGAAQKSEAKPAAQKSEATPAAAGVPSARASDPVWQVMADLAYLDLHPPDLSPPNTAAYARAFDTDPERTEQGIEKRIALVPYEGSLSTPADLLTTGLANSLDRAQLVQAVLKSSGIEARIVSTGQDGKIVFAKYPATMPVNLPPVKPDVLEALRKEVSEVSPLVLAKLKKQKGGNWAASLTGAKMEKRLYWVQYQRSGNWVDLVPEDTTVPESKRSSAQVLSPDDLAALQWQVKLTVTNSFSAGPQEQQVLTFSAPASDLNGAALTFFNRPDDSQQFTPYFFYGDKTLPGTKFPVKQDDHELDHQLLKIDVAGPSGSRHFERVLVGPKGTESNSERMLEIATLARITVVTRSISDEEFKRSISGNLAQCARLVFGKAGELQSGPSANFVSPAAIGVLDTSHRAAGLGAAGEQVLAFQGRPALALEHDFLQVNGDALEHRHSFDLIDPGHSEYAPKAGKDTMVQAAIEQSVVDAWLEDRVTSGKTVLTSRGAVHELLASAAPLNISKPPAMLGADKYGTIRPAYLLGAATQGKAAGWRFDPGPQLVPVLWNYSGGTESADTPVARVQKLCDAIPKGLWFVPAEVFPQKFLVGGLVKYDCALQKAYLAAASRIEDIGRLIGGEAPASPGVSDDDLKKMIDELGPDLVKNILLGALGQAGSGLGVHGVLGEEPEHSSATDQIIRYLTGVGADALSDNAAEKLKEYLGEIQKSSQEGKSPDQIERDIAKDFSPR